MQDRISEGCRRCGTCCRKGGPALHMEDRELVLQGAIETDRLFTIRRGEPVYDNIVRSLVAAEDDLIKIRGRAGSWSCTYYDTAVGCRIYGRRPLECRVLTCWDTAEMERVYRSNRLTRADLLGGVEGLWDLIRDHQLRCGYDEIDRLLAGFADGDRAAATKLREMMLYDLHLRRQMTEKRPATAQMTDFLLGRPLKETLKPLGVTLIRENGRIQVRYRHTNAHPAI